MNRASVSLDDISTTQENKDASECSGKLNVALMYKINQWKTTETTLKFPDILANIRSLYHNNQFSKTEPVSIQEANSRSLYHEYSVFKNGICFNSENLDLSLLAVQLLLLSATILIHSFGNNIFNTGEIFFPPVIFVNLERYNMNEEIEFNTRTEKEIIEYEMKALKLSSETILLLIFISTSSTESSLSSLITIILLKVGNAKKES
uniref:Uncharacterized protein n=1 Tax=Onchocerca volvulus TaxID=6282 RepID=A0A8R1XX71_ONCVO